MTGVLDERPEVLAAEARARALPPLGPKDHARGASGKRWAAYPLQIVGGGPWMVLPNCPAPRHNTLTAGRGRMSAGRRHTEVIGEKCICPHALELVEATNEKARQKRRRRRRGELPPGPTSKTPVDAQVPVKRPVGTYLPGYVSNSRGGPAASLDGQGLCRTSNGRDIADRVISATEPRGHWLKLHRSMCDACPVQQRCLDWAQRNEEPAGSWDGMYGGLTQRERSQQR